MEHMIKDGIAFTLTNGSIIPLEYNRSVTFISIMHVAY